MQDLLARRKAAVSPSCNLHIYHLVRNQLLCVGKGSDRERIRRYSVCGFFMDSGCFCILLFVEITMAPEGQHSDFMQEIQSRAEVWICMFQLSCT